MGEERRTGRHSVVMEKREQASITGVTEVISFDEESIIADTEMGMMILKGVNLHVSKLNLEDGELVIEGDIDSLEYSDGGFAKGKGSLLSRIFK